MSASTLREQIVAKLDEAELAALLRYIEAIQAEAQPENYDPAKDPTIGMFSGPPDLAKRTKEILPQP